MNRVPRVCAELLVIASSPHWNVLALSKLFRVLLDFCYGCSNFVHVFFIAQQHGLREPNRFPRSFLGYWKFSLQKLVFVFGLLAAQPLAVFAISKHVQLVQRWITCLMRNAFSIQR